MGAFAPAYHPVLFPSVLLKLKQLLTGLPECVLLVPPSLGEHRAVVARSLLVPSELLSEDMGFPPSAPIVFSNSTTLTVSHSPPDVPYSRDGKA